MFMTIDSLPGLPTIEADAIDQLDINQFDIGNAAAQHPPRRSRAVVRSMNAAFITRTGSADVIQYGELPRPVPGPGQVLIRVGAAAVNPIDVEIRSGALPMPLRFPYIIGSDVAGTVVLRGIGVRQFAEGDRVWGSNQGWLGRQGTFAEYVAIDEKWLYPTPQFQSDAEAAAGAMDGISACLSLFRAARLRVNDIVFVDGGAGGVGSAVVQQAKAAGARVITTAVSPAAQAFCHESRADLVLDPQSPTLDDEIRAFAEPFGGVGVWIETGREPALRRTVGLMAPGGRIVLVNGNSAQPAVPLEELRSANLTIHGVSMPQTLPDVQRQCAVTLNARYTYGSWRPRIGLTRSLSQAAAAQQEQEQEIASASETRIGKIVVAPDA